MFVLTLRRPERLNALTWELIDELHAAFEAVGRNTQCRVLVLTGEGRGFCSGLDLKDEDAPLGGDRGIVDVLRRQERAGSLATALRALPQPVIAAVNGAAAGAGFALALAADIRVATQHASFHASPVRVGLSACDVGVSYLLPRIVGLGVASEIMLTGRRVDAAEALEMGLVNRVVDADELLEATLDLASVIAQNSPLGIEMTKRVLALNVDAASLDAAVELENRTQIITSRTHDSEEAVAAFLEKRPSTFSGR